MVLIFAQIGCGGKWELPHQAFAWRCPRPLLGDGILGGPHPGGIRPPDAYLRDSDPPPSLEAACLTIRAAGKSALPKAVRTSFWLSAAVEEMGAFCKSFNKCLLPTNQVLGLIW